MAKYSYLSTGLSSGIGGAARPRIESSHPELYHIMLCRNPHKFSTLKNTTAIKVDLESIESIRNALVEVKTLLENGNVPPLKYVLNNAGAQYKSRAIKTHEGYEVTFQVNVIAPFLIILTMLPYLRKVQAPRVFVTGSFVHFADDEHAHGWVPPMYWNENDVRELMLPNKTKGSRSWEKGQCHQQIGCDLSCSPVCSREPGSQICRLPPRICCFQWIVQQHGH